MSLIVRSVFSSLVLASICSRGAAFGVSRHRQFGSHKVIATQMTASSDIESNKSAKVAPLAKEHYATTPLILSNPISKLVGQPVYLKLDALQASGSFKDRGMAHLCATFQEQGVQKLISSSGGNAGLAVATVGSQLGMSVSVIVPETTKPLVIAKLQSLGADVTIHGKNWNAADSLARERVAEDTKAQYVSPYDNPLLWTGHSTIVDEIVQELSEPVGAIVVSVGGGGLVCGVLEGCARQGISPAVLTCETDGASSLAQAWKAGEVVTLPGIDSIATSLGATSVTPVALERAEGHSGSFEAVTCTDQEAVDACLRLAQDHRLLVEPACGAGLAIAYSERLRNKYLKDIKGPIVLEVCGGSGVSLALLEEWKKQFDL